MDIDKVSKVAIGIVAITVLIVFLTTNAFAQESGYETKPYEDDHPLIFPSYSERFIQPSPSAPTTPTANCWNLSYTIEFTTGSTIAQQEELVRFLTEEFWGQYVDICWDYKPNANPDDVYGLIQMNANCGKGEGCGGGDGPNTWCIAANGTGSYFDGRMKLILAHEIGHCLGLNHYGGINAFDCMMVTYVQPSLTQCNIEINDLKNLWANAQCTIPACMPEGTSVTNGVMVSLTPSKIPIQGDILTLTYTIKNIGNTQLTQSVWIRDYTDDKQLYFSGAGLLLPGQSKSISFTWDITTASIGEHKIKAWYISHRNEITRDDNLVDFFIEVFSSAPPIPPPSLDYTIDSTDTLLFFDNINVTVTKGEDPRIKDLEDKIIELQTLIDGLLTDITTLTNDKDLLLNEVVKLQIIIDQIKVLVN